MNRRLASAGPIKPDPALRRMYQRYLSQWAMDWLACRAAMGGRIGHVPQTPAPAGSYAAEWPDLYGT